MKYIGIDYGTKKVGIAVSDALGNIAFPKKIIQNSPTLVQDILDILREEKIEVVVVGKSLDALGESNRIQKEINLFIKTLSCHFAGEIIEQDERGSSVHARSHLYGKGNIENEKWTGRHNQKKRAHIDAGAAAIILQRYLDRK